MEQPFQDIPVRIAKDVIIAPDRSNYLVAANLAASFALGYKRKTILVDFYINKPMLHRVFNIDAKPGLIESFNNQQIWVTQTKIEQLYVLPSGDYKNYTLGLKDLVAIRDVIYSLEREFEFIIIDMGSILPIDDFPALFANEVDGLLMVVDTKKTKRKEIDEVFQYIDDTQILGFVLNRMKNPHSKRK
jgi:Mrp family chromosome partitioning ATPase